MLESFFNKVAGVQATPTQAFSCGYYKIFKSNLFIGHLWGLLLYFGQSKYQILKSLENLRTLDDLNFTNFLSDRVMGDTSYRCSSFYSFRKFSFPNWLLQNSCFCLLPPHQNATVSAAFIKLFQTTSSRESYWKISLLLMPICFNISFCLLSADRRPWKVCSTKGALHCSFRRAV